MQRIRSDCLSREEQKPDAKGTARIPPSAPLRSLLFYMAVNRVDNFKFAIIGQNGVGKSSLFAQFLKGDPDITKLEDKERGSKDVMIDRIQATVNLTIIRDGDLRSLISYELSHEFHGFLVVFSQNCPTSFLALERYLEIITVINGGIPPPTVIVANMEDVDNKFNMKKAEAMSNLRGLSYTETCSFSAFTVDRAVFNLARKIRGQKKNQTRHVKPCSVL